jgi:autotransporter-associated beta strand protein
VPSLEGLEIRIAPAIATWIGASHTSANWSEPGNWSGGNTPQAGDELLFPDNPSGLTTVNDFAPGTRFHSLTISGAGYSMSGAGIVLDRGITADYTSGTSTDDIPVILGNATISVNKGATLDQRGTVEASGLTKEGEGTLVLSGVHRCPGTAVVNQGVLSLKRSSALAGTVGVTVANNAELDLSGGISIGNIQLTLHGSGTSGGGALRSIDGVNISTGPFILADHQTTIGVDSGSLELYGAPGSDLVTKVGEGTLVLVAQTVEVPQEPTPPYSTYLNTAVDVLGGMLDISGDMFFSVDLGPGTTLRGLVYVARLYDHGGTISPGTASSTGHLTVGGSLHLDHSSTLSIRIGGTLDSECDSLWYDGYDALDLNNTTLSASLVGGYIPTPGQQFTIINNVNVPTISGTFEGLPEGAHLSIDGVPFQISYRGTARQYNGHLYNNDVVLTAFDSSFPFCSLTSDGNVSTYGQAVSFTATVTSAAGIPTGVVDFFDGSTLLGSRILDGSGVASFSTSTLNAGTHSITAAYRGDGSFNPSTSNTIRRVVNQRRTSILLDSDVNPILLGQSVTFTAGVGPAEWWEWGEVFPTGSVEFFDGSASIGTVPLDASIPYELVSRASLSTSSLSVGIHSITAVFLGGVNFVPSTSRVVSQVVNRDSTPTLTSDNNETDFGQTATFTVRVTAAAGIPTGIVSLLDGTELLGTGTLDDSGAATFAVSTLTVGSHSITAFYQGDATFSPSTSLPITQTVRSASTATTLSSGLNPSVFGQSVTFTARVAAVAPGSGIPTGTVVFRLGSGERAEVALDATGVASYTMATVGPNWYIPAGTEEMTAIYLGDAGFSGSTSNLVYQVIEPAGVDITLTSDANPGVFGQTITFTAVVAATSPGIGIPLGWVEFFDGKTHLAFRDLSWTGVTTLATSALAVGSHTITAVYTNGYSPHSPPADRRFSSGSHVSLRQEVVGQGTSTTLTSSPSSSTVGQTVTLTATVRAASSAHGFLGGLVTFLDGSTPIGSVALKNGVATLSTHTLAAGTHAFRAIYRGNSYYAPSTSEPVSTRVARVETTTSLAGPLEPWVYGQTATFTATVSTAGPGSPTPSGSVAFLDGSTPIGTAPLTRGVATFRIQTLAAGSHSITAVYKGDSNAEPATSPAAIVTVVPAPTTTRLTSSAQVAVNGQNVTYTATVHAGAATPTGKVAFYENGRLFGTVALVGGRAILNGPIIGAGLPHLITAKYLGDSNCLPSHSDTGVTVAVDRAETQVILTSQVIRNDRGRIFGVLVYSNLRGAPPGSGVPTGYVVYHVNGRAFSSDTLRAGAAIRFLPYRVVRNKTLTVEYPGFGNYKTGISAPLNLGRRFFHPASGPATTLVGHAQSARPVQVRQPARAEARRG